MNRYVQRSLTQAVLAATLLFALLCRLPHAALADDTASAGFRFAESSGVLSLSEGGRAVLAYNYGIQKKSGVPDDRARSCYIHPLYGLDGEILSDDFPVDHYHHRGLFWAWPHIRIGDNEYDLWMLRGIRHQFTRWIERSAGANAAVLACENGWLVEERCVVREELRCVVHQAVAAGRFIDVELQLAATSEPVTLWGADGKSYGGLSLRFAPREQTVITTPAGRQPEDINLERLPWADLAGRFVGAKAESGVALLVARDHPNYQPQWITRHYGFLGVGWPGTEPATLEPGKSTTCRYRLWIHRGLPDTDALHQAYATFTASAKSNTSHP